MPAEPRVQRGLSFLLLCLALAFPALAIASLHAWRVELPLWDLWPYAGEAFDAFRPSAILRAHNEHVAATTAAVLWLDRWLAEGSYGLALWAAVGVILAALLLMVSAAWRLLRPFPSERGLTVALLVLTLASVAAFQDAAHPFLLQHLLLSLLTLAAALLVAPRTMHERPWAAVLLASLLSLLAVVTQANGAALPFLLVLLWALANGRLPAAGRTAVLLLPALALFAWLYLLRQEAPSLGDTEWPSVGVFIDFLLRLLGTAAGLGGGSDTIARLAGALVALLALPAALGLLLAPRRLLGDALGFAASTLFLLTAAGLVASAAARAATSPSTLYVKYGYYSLLFAGLAAYLDQRLLPRRWSRPWLYAALAALGLVNATLLWRAPYILERQAQQLRAEAAGYVFLLDETEFCRVAECQPDHLAMLRHLRDEGLNVFAWPETAMLGQALPSDSSRESSDCAGQVERAERLTSGEGESVLRLSGWLGDSLAPRQAIFFVAADDTARSVLGFGFASDLPAAGPDGSLRQAWRGYLMPGETSGAVLALVSSGGETCPVGSIALPD